MGYLYRYGVVKILVRRVKNGHDMLLAPLEFHVTCTGNDGEKRKKRVVFSCPFPVFLFLLFFLFFCCPFFFFLLFIPPIFLLLLLISRFLLSYLFFLCVSFRVFVFLHVLVSAIKEELFF